MPQDQLSKIALAAVGAAGAEPHGGDDLFRLLKDFEGQQHEIQQLCHFSATAADDVANVQLGGCLADMAKHHDLEGKINEAHASSESRAAYSLAVSHGKAIGAVRSHVRSLLDGGSDVATAKLSWMIGDASAGADLSTKVLTWLQAFAAALENLVAKARAQADEDLVQRTLVLTNHLEGFSEQSTEVAANQVKKSSMNLEMDLNEINEMIPAIGEEQLGSAIAAAAELEKSAGATLRWGIYQLAYKNKLIRHLEQGAKARKFLKQIVETYETDFEKHLSEEEKANVRDILKCGSGPDPASSGGAAAAADGAQAEEAAAPEEAEPPRKKARKGPPAAKGAAA